MEVSSPPDTAWKRTGCKEEDQLHIYTSGEMYDCSFNVCGQDKASQLFKCHKVILGTASSVFQTMLFDDSKALGKDDQIPIENVSPAAFDLAMKYIYGNIQEFGSPSLAVQVYRFAHEMKIVALMAKVERFLKIYATPTDIFEVIELYKATENADGLIHAWKVFNKNTAQALQSPSWLTVSPGTVREVLENDNIYVNELTLFAAVVEWGKTHALKEEGSEVDDSKVRTTISPFLKLIRFSGMNSREFAELCKTTQVLSSDEKLAIIMSLNLSSPEFVPEEFAGASQSVRKVLAVICLKFTPNTGLNKAPSSVSFQLNKRARLVGLQVHASDPTFEAELKNVSMELSDNEGCIQSCGVYTAGALIYQGKKYFKVRVDKDFLLAPKVKYTLQFTMPEVATAPVVYTSREDCYESHYIVGEGLTVTLLTKRTCAPISHLIFDLV